MVEQEAMRRRSVAFAMMKEVPLGIPGRIFGSPMPFSRYDPEGWLLEEFRKAGIELVVVLAEHEECLQKSGRDLIELYEREGFDVIHVPTPDFSVPEDEDVEYALAAVEAALRQGLNVAVHCGAGVGRTGLFLALLACRILGLNAEDALRWVRRHYLPQAVEVGEQKLFLKRFCSRRSS